MNLENIVIDKLVHGGQGLGTAPDGRKIFVWNAIPGEIVDVKVLRRRKDYLEGIAEGIKKESVHRVEPIEPDIYLSTSPWQIMDLGYENESKKKIVTETFSRESIELPDFLVTGDDNAMGYRNKIEFSFFGDENGLHYAFYGRGTHGKRIVEGSALARPEINSAAKEFLVELNKINVRAGDLKSVIFRCTQDGSVVAALFTKLEKIEDISLPEELSGLRVYFSNPKSPASVVTRLLSDKGDTRMSDVLLGTRLSYDVVGFFQVNIPVFEKAVLKIREYTADFEKVIDMYAGVGSIGILLDNTTALVELDESNVEMAKVNAVNRDIEVIHASTEKALDYIKSDVCVVLDPPRGGLHKDVIARLLSEKPEVICYLSCNPVTQARDVALLDEGYSISDFECYNFFPRTPHIETLIVLKRKD